MVGFDSRNVLYDSLPFALVGLKAPCYSHHQYSVNPILINSPIKTKMSIPVRGAMNGMMLYRVCLLIYLVETKGSEK